MTRMQALFLALMMMLTGASSSLALEIRDGDISLVPQPPPKPSVFGIEFGSRPKPVTSALTEAGLKLLTQKKQDPRGYVKVLLFDGIPPGLALREGRSHLVFFKNCLVRIDLQLNPTYSNFLLVRRQLFAASNKRFTIGQKKETLDIYLRSHLALLEKGGYDETAEGLVWQSLKSGKTFFHYSLDDARGELTITLTYAAPRSVSGGEGDPELVLHYSAKDGMHQYRAHYNPQKQQSLLPPRQTGSALTPAYPNAR